jgi:hypothetical protein
VSVDVASGDTLTLAIEMDILPVQLSAVNIRAREER